MESFYNYKYINFNVNMADTSKFYTKKNSREFKMIQEVNI